MATIALVSLAEYEQMSFERDVEYIDGELRERGMVMSVHGLMQGRFMLWFGNHEKEWGIKAAVEVRTQVTPANVRLPDVVVGPRKRWPQTLVEPPLIVIEIVSPSDSFSDIEEVVADYQQMGIENIWVVDPQKRVGWIYEAGTRIQARLLRAKTGLMYVDLDQIFAELDEADGEDEQL